MTSPLPEKQVLTITQLNRRARQLLETHLPLLWVRGEISNFSRPGSGHWYFTLKDSDAQIRCAMFRNRNELARIKPRDGDQVLVRGRVSLYENRGEYQLIVEHMEADGAGLLQQQFEALKQKLLMEGLFRPEIKKPLPPFPLRIGIITSPTGAAIRDVLHVSARRYPWVDIMVYPATVQGKEAAGQIAAAIGRANRHNAVDVLILTRGGGSLEDLWAFNEEAVARAIHNSVIPIISAIGHESDFTIADFAADVRAPTPSAAAEIAGPDREALEHRIASHGNLLARRIQSVIAQYRLSLGSLGKRLRSPADRLREQSQHLDHLEIRLAQAWVRALNRATMRFEQANRRLEYGLKNIPLGDYQHKTSLLHGRLVRAMASSLDRQHRTLQGLCATLNAVSPLNTLERGYAIARDGQGKPVHSIAQLKTGDSIEVQIRDGAADCIVAGVRPAMGNTLRNGDLEGT